jgi:hypothetical protein
MLTWPESGVSSHFSWSSVAICAVLINGNLLKMETTSMDMERVRDADDRLSSNY